MGEAADQSEQRDQTAELSGRVALVVGGPQVTRAVAEGLVAAGCRVVVGDTSGAGLPAAASGEPWLGTLDASTPDAVAGLADSAYELGGRLDVLVQHHPATARVSVGELDLEHWERDLGQLTRALTVARGFARRARPGSAIVSLGSIDISAAYPGRATSSVVSNALVGLDRALAVEWATVPIRVNTVALGVTLTPAEQEAVARGDLSMERVHLRSPGHHLGDLSEAAALVRFLVGPGAEFITGQVIWADGGWSALTQHAEGLRFP
jgi:gluconate 5-dehydrogenase